MPSVALKNIFVIWFQKIIGWFRKVEPVNNKPEPAPRKLINPRLLKVHYEKHRSHRFGKLYAPFVGRPCAARFRTATNALAYAQKVHARWCRLYDYAIANMVEVGQ